MILASRKRRGEDPFLPWKLRLFVAGAVFLVLAMVLERPAIALASVLVLGIALVLRAIGERRADEAADREDAGEATDRDGDDESAAGDEADGVR